MGNQKKLLENKKHNLAFVNGGYLLLLGPVYRAASIVRGALCPGQQQGPIALFSKFNVYCDCLAGRINGKLRKCPRIAVCADWGIKALDSTEPVMYLQ